MTLAKEEIVSLQKRCTLEVKCFKTFPDLFKTTNKVLMTCDRQTQCSRLSILPSTAQAATVQATLPFSANVLQP